MRAKVLNWIFILLIISSGLSQAQNRVRYTAVPIDGYSFKSWDDGNTTNSRIINLSSIPSGLSSVPLISVSEPITLTTIKLADNILTSTRGVVLMEVLDGNTNTPLNTLTASVSIPALKASFEPAHHDDIVIVPTNNPCNIAHPGEITLKFVPKGVVSINGYDFTTTYDYYMSETEITQVLWNDVMGCGSGDNPSHFSGNYLPVESVSWYHAVYFCNKLSGMMGFPKVYSIGGTKDESQWGDIPTSNNSTWNAVVCDWTANGVRLPTEVEWMHAAKEGRNSSYTYSGSDNADDVSWYENNSYGETHAVKGKNANYLGLYDMTGNVYEWCWDWNGDLPNGGTDYRGASMPSQYPKRVIKGGCYGSYAPSELNLSVRDQESPHVTDYNYYYMGFRIVIPSSN